MLNLTHMVKDPTYIHAGQLMMTKEKSFGFQIFLLERMSLQVRAGVTTDLFIYFLFHP